MKLMQGGDLRLGMVGFGLRAQIWREAHRPGEGAVVCAVLDTSERGRLDASATLPGVYLATDIDDLIAQDIDAALVLTPDDQHRPVAEALLNAGVAVFCEKPLATTTEDADAILSTAIRSGTRLYVGHNLRHMPVITLMKRLIDQGAIGEVKAVWCRHFVGHGGDFYFKDWHADRTRSTGLLLQKGAHDIDAIHWLAGSRTNRVNAIGRLSLYGENGDRKDRSSERMRDWFSVDNWPPESQRGLSPVIDVEDISQMNMLLENGVLAAYQQCHFSPDYWRNYTVIGSAGRLENFGDEVGAEVHVWNRRHMHAAVPDEVHRVPEIDETLTHGGADRLLMSEFLHFVREGGPTTTSPIAARDAVATAVAATVSLRTGGDAQHVPSVSDDIRAYFNRAQA